jgi:hypothetical protein
MVYIYQLDYFNEDNVVEENTDEQDSGEEQTAENTDGKDDAEPADSQANEDGPQDSDSEEIAEEVEPSLLTVYYLVIVPNVNDSNTVDAQNIFGEKVYFTESERAELNFEAYVNRVFGRTYTIEKVVTDQPEQSTEQEPISE